MQENILKRFFVTNVYIFLLDVQILYSSSLASLSYPKVYETSFIRRLYSCLLLAIFLSSYKVLPLFPATLSILPVCVFSTNRQRNMGTSCLPVLVYTGQFISHPKDVGKPSELFLPLHQRFLYNVLHKLMFLIVSNLQITKYNYYNNLCASERW